MYWLATNAYKVVMGTQKQPTAPSLDELWNHIHSGSCRGQIVAQQPVGVRLYEYSLDIHIQPTLIYVSSSFMTKQMSPI